MALVGAAARDGMVGAAAAAALVIATRMAPAMVLRAPFLTDRPRRLPVSAERRMALSAGISVAPRRASGLAPPPATARLTSTQAGARASAAPAGVVRNLEAAAVLEAGADGWAAAVVVSAGAAVNSPAGAEAGAGGSLRGSSALRGGRLAIAISYQPGKHAS